MGEKNTRLSPKYRISDAFAIDKPPQMCYNKIVKALRRTACFLCVLSRELLSLAENSGKEPEARIPLSEPAQSAAARPRYPT